MADFDPEKFEDKYVHYFTELQRAYKNAFETMNDAYDSDLVHAIDQQVLNESEPFYEDGRFTVELPAEPTERVTAVVADDRKVEATLERYVAEIERELYVVFGLEPPADVGATGVGDDDSNGDQGGDGGWIGEDEETEG